MHDAMIDDFLVKDIVLMGRYPHKTRFGNYTRRDVAIAESYMEHIGISHLANEEVQHLSGGELQRAFIAKALTQEPTILLLDEPTNHLDLKYKLALMKELQTFKGTVIVVLHDIQLAATYCDNIVLMNKGRIVKTGSPQEVLTPKLLEPVLKFPLPQDRRRYLSYSILDFIAFNAKKYIAICRYIVNLLMLRTSSRTVFTERTL